MGVHGRIMSKWIFKGVKVGLDSTVSGYTELWAFINMIMNLQVP
jgi:hypothetical protein